ncbi:MAG: histidine--tRNA ligase [Bacteroidia bacterium]|nr:histidine--tRNA ligase [Bacteroidia bacterium]
MKYPNVKGTRDFAPDILAKRKYILNIIESVFKKYGFLALETPALEQLDTLTGKYGDEGDKLLFKVLNSGDFASKVDDNIWSSKQSENIAKFISEKGLRYDLTVPLARFVATNRNDITFPFKRYQMQPVWRADRPQRGRYREFWQCDADILGSNTLINEAEILTIAVEIFKKLNIPIQISLNNRKILEAIAEKLGISEKFNLFTVLIDKLDKINFVDLSKDFENIGLSKDKIAELSKILSTQYFNKESINIILESLNNNANAQKGCDELLEILSFISLIEKFDANIKIDLSLARGLDYYTGCIIEIKCSTAKMGSIAGGGRYDNLTGVFGLPGVSGIGISFGIDRIYDIMEEMQLFNDVKTTDTKIVLCQFDKKGQLYNFKIAAMLRENGISCEVYPDLKKINKQLEYAEKKGIEYVIISGEEEINSQILSVKNLKSRIQEKIDVKNIISYFK